MRRFAHGAPLKMETEYYKLNQEYDELQHQADKLATALEQVIKDMKNWTTYNKMEYGICEALNDYNKFKTGDVSE